MYVVDGTREGIEQCCQSRCRELFYNYEIENITPAIAKSQQDLITSHEVGLIVLTRPDLALDTPV